MIQDRSAIRVGAVLRDPIGRSSKIHDIFVPKNHPEKRVSPSFRNAGRKIIVFDNGGVLPFAEALKRYSLAQPKPQTREEYLENKRLVGGEGFFATTLNRPIQLQLV